MKYAISSNKTFAPFTYEAITQGLLEVGVNPDDIYFFEGGHDTYSQYVNDGIRVVRVPYNSMDFNGLIAIMDLGLCADRWFLLHDTCIINRGFHTYVSTFEHKYPATALCSRGLSMNIGSYSQDYIESIKYHLEDLKNNGDLGEYKAKLVMMEDCFLNPYKQVSHYTDVSPQVTGPIVYHENSAKRILQCYPDVGLCKTKANWEPKEQYELNL